MNKYLSVTKNSLGEFFAYRLNFILWRVRVVVSILITFFLWVAIYSSKNSIFNYSSKEMFTYIVLMSFINSIVLSTQTGRVADEINNGALSSFLIRPIEFISYNLFRDLADKILNTFFSIIEIGIILLILRPPFIWQNNPGLIILFLISIVISVFLYFFISLILSFIGFWSHEVWAPRFIFFIIVAFLAGTYFPLDIVPKPVYSFLQLLPFTYLIFFPLKIYLGKVESIFLIKGFIISSVWLVILYFLTKHLWHKGLKAFTAEGI